MALDGAVDHADHGVMNTAVDDLLEGTWLASDMTPDVRRKLAGMSVVADYPAGTLLIRAGESCTALGVIIHGRVAIRPAVPGSEPRTILTLEDGDLFCWSAVLPGSKATSSAVAMTATRALLIDRASLAEACETDPRLGLVVHQRVLAAVARRLQSTRMQLLDLYRAGDEPW